MRRREANRALLPFRSFLSLSLVPLLDDGRTVDPVGNEDVGVLCLRANGRGGAHCVPGKERERKSVIARDECRRRKVDEQTNKERGRILILLDYIMF